MEHDCGEKDEAGRAAGHGVTWNDKHPWRTLTEALCVSKHEED